MVVACGGAAVHTKSVFYCIILWASKHKVMLAICFLRRSLEMTPRSVWCIRYLLSGLWAQSTVDFPIGGHVNVLSDYKETGPEKKSKF